MVVFPDHLNVETFLTHRWRTRQLRVKIFRHELDRDEIEDVYDEWDDALTSDLEIRFKQLRQFNRTLNESYDEDLIDMTEKNKDALKPDTIELVANQIYNKLTILFDKNRKKFGRQNGIPIEEPIRNCYNLKLADNGN